MGNEEEEEEEEDVMLTGICRLESAEICAQFVSHQGIWDTAGHADPQGYEDPRRLPWV